MRRLRAFTVVELLVVISIIAILIGILLPAIARAQRTADMSKGATQLKSIHQVSVAFAQSNRQFLPGMLDAKTPQPAGLTNTGSATNNGTYATSRAWILIKNSYTNATSDPMIFVNPGDPRVK